MKRYVKEFAVDILRTVGADVVWRKDMESKVDSIIKQYEGNYITAFEAVEQLVKIAIMLTEITDKSKQRTDKPKQRKRVEYTYDIAKIKELVRDTEYRFDTQAYEKDETVQIMRAYTIKSNPYVYEGIVSVLRPINETTITVEINYEKITTQTQSLPTYKEGRTLYTCDIKSQDCKTIYDLLFYNAIQWDRAYIKQILVQHGKSDIADKIKLGYK